MIRQWSSSAPRAHDSIALPSRNSSSEKSETMSNESPHLTLRTGSPSVAMVSAPAPPGSTTNSRVITVSTRGNSSGGSPMNPDSEEEDSDFESEDDEGLSTLYEEEESEPVLDDLSRNFQYYSIDDVNLDDVTPQYDKMTVNSTILRDVTPTPSPRNVTPTPQSKKALKSISPQSMLSSEGDNRVSHSRHDSDEPVGNLVRRKVTRAKKMADTSKHNVHERLRTATPHKRLDAASPLRDLVRDELEKNSNKQSIHHVLPRHIPEVPRLVRNELEFANDFNEVAEREMTSARSETSLTSGMSGLSARPQHFVVVAVDFGTTYSGYAFSFVDRPDSIHMMRRWAGGDPGISNQKTPTTLLLKPNGTFHSFGFEARDFYHDLEPAESKKWYYFERFKMALHANKSLNKDTQLIATNRKPMPAIQVFAHALKFFKKHALQELSDELGTHMRSSDIRWVVTVPAIWRPQAKQFMREAAYKAKLASEDNPNQLVIALEPEAASIYCRKLRNTQLQSSSRDMPTVQESLKSGNQYMVVDCGGGTVDVTVHRVVGDRSWHLQEVRAASGGAMGSVAVDAEFEKLLRDIFSDEFMNDFRKRRPAGVVDLFVAWESRKRSASPSKNCSLNISLPFSFIDLLRKTKNSTVEEAVRKYGDPNVKWSSQGMLRITPSLMRRLFNPTLDAIVDHVDSQIDSKISHLFLVGGFAESPLLQQKLRSTVGDRVRVIIPNDVSLTILKGAVLFGLDPTTVRMRTSQMTYGVGILNAFDETKHPRRKRLVRDGHVWCTDVFDAYVVAGRTVGLGDVVQRSYAPVRRGQSAVVINLYSCEKSNVKFIDEEGVQKCATLRVKLPAALSPNATETSKRELQISMMYGDTEIKVHCLDVVTGTKVNATIDFFST